MKKLTIVLAALAFAGAATNTAGAADGDTVKAIKARGELLCGVSTGVSTGMSTLDNQGNWKGMEVEFCRGLAAAVLGDPSKVKFVPLEFRVAFTTLQSGAADILARTATWSYSRDTSLNLDWAGVYMYDGQGFMVAKKLGAKSGKELNGASICVSAGTTSELNLADYFRANNLKFTAITGSTREQNQQNLEAGRCDAYSNERGGLAASRTAMKNPDDWVILPDVFSKEPLGPTVRQDDARFRDIVAWTLNIIVAAEEFGITRANVSELTKTSTNPEVQRMLGKSGEFGKMLGLEQDWAAKVIATTGNYAELYDRNLGNGSPIKLERGLNSLWSNGGLLYSPPFR
ncbi:general L-amino acid transport system substrate-binding protein [Bosea sp. CRIB-10]|uniref:amino acid ABC transporter substrate-binding protein n=1 Tax=Bosea sp. CRIB-10 TaxID=378404 RepID=UPI0008F2F240|nr:amino acid ABC transporter substrate-binding protein [Bosea sp. CRIB-10]SFC82321.1 general L-amino acid transport system substrate-binding protein [Bosea sp. CRIB-10]